MMDFFFEMQEMQKINEDHVNRTSCFGICFGKEDPPADQLDPSIHHPWRNHVGLSCAGRRGLSGLVQGGIPEVKFFTQ